MCVQAMRSFIDRPDRIKKVKPFSARNVTQKSLKKLFKKKKRLEKTKSPFSGVIDLTSSPPPMEEIDRQQTDQESEQEENPRSKPGMNFNFDRKNDFINMDIIRQN